MTIDPAHFETALARTGDRLLSLGVEGPVDLYLIGGMAGLLSGLLPKSRATTDADVARVDPASAWSTVKEAANDVADEMQLPRSWLNDECRIYEWSLPLGWRDRCDASRGFGPLRINLISRKDFICAKIISGSTRFYDIEDVIALSPTGEELDFAQEHLDRLEREHLGADDSFTDAHASLRELRGEL